MNRKRLLRKLSQGALQNVKFAEACDLVEAFGFRRARTRGSHHIFVSAAVPELINLQAAALDSSRVQSAASRLSRINFANSCASSNDII